MPDKERERTFVQALLSSQSSLPGFTLVESEERPAFVLQRGERLIGVEVTELFHDPDEGAQPRQEKESLQRQLCIRAQRIWNDRGLPSVHVALHFSHFHRLSKRWLERIATRLVDLVARAVPEPGKGSQLEYDWTNRDVHPEEVPHVRVYAFDDRDPSSWTHSDAEWSRSLTPSQIQREIDRKTNRLPSYRTPLQEIWLLLAIDGFRLSGFFSLPEQVSEQRYTSSFDKVYLVHRLEQKSIELNTDPAA